MKSIKIKSLRKGMVTASDVKDRMGRTLLTAGQSITEQNLKTLKAWGITEVNVEGSRKPRKVSQEEGRQEERRQEEGQIDVKASPAIIKEQETLFKFTDRRHPAVAELYNICLARKIQIRQEDQQEGK